MPNTVNFKDKITNDGSPDVRGILEAFQVARADGNTSATDIAVAGIKTTAKILAVFEVTATTAALVDHTSEASVTSAGNIQLDTTDTTGDDLLVFYFNTD